MKKRLAIFLFLSISSFAVWGGNDLIVKVVGVNSTEGAVRLGLYGQAEGFMEEDKALTVQESKASIGTVVFRIRDLPAGNYGISAYHDKNGDRSFNVLLGLFPQEGYGYSVNDDINAEESFENSRFAHNPDNNAEITVFMRYCRFVESNPGSKLFTCQLSETQ